MSDLRTEIVELVGTVRSYTDPGDTADDILSLLAERLTSDGTVREVADVHAALAPHPLMRELLVRGILNTATYAAGVRTAPGDAGVTTGEGA